MDVYSSIHMKERDKVLSEKHQKEIQALEGKIQRIKYSHDETAKQLFEALHRGRRLAQSLGFDDVYDAQVFVDSADHDMSFKECYQRLQMMEAQLAGDNKEVEILEAKLRNSESKRARLEAELKQSAESRVAEQPLRDQLAVLNKQYDSLKDVKERAAERYKADFKKWRAFSNWLFAEEDHHDKHRHEPGISAEEKKKRDIASVMRKRQKIIEIGPDLARFEGEPDDPEDVTTPKRPPLGPTEMDYDKENESTSAPPAKKRRVSSPLENTSSPRLPSVPLRNTLLRSVTNVSAPSSSPTIFLPTTTTPSRVALAFQPVPPLIQDCEPPSSTPSPLGGKPALPLRRANAMKPHLPSSSDTEDDSQAVYVPSCKKQGVFKVPAPPTSLKRNPPPSTPNSSSDTEEDSQALDEPPPAPRPISTPLPPAKRKSDTALSQSVRTNHTIMTNSADRATKGQADGFKVPIHPPDDPWSQPGPSTSKNKGKEKEKEDMATPTMKRTAGQSRMDDYSAFKGRGRYGNAGEVDQNDSTTINASYMINTEQNGGLDYQYDEVVRTRDDRKRMDAGDCECCRDYYEAVGPLPNRLQAPLWRSPPGTPSKPCAQHGHRNSDPTHHPTKDAEIESHRKAISRHRHNWARASTPPGYWNIGFPNTQEVGNINEKAKEMHKRKKEGVEREARSGSGRYRRK